jgi:hypothetical protein
MNEIVYRLEGHSTLEVGVRKRNIFIKMPNNSI